MIKYLYSFLFIILSLQSCSFGISKSNFDIKDVGKRENIVQTVSANEIKAIIQQKNYTLLYFYTTWCKPCLETLKNEIRNSLDTLSDKNLNIVIIWSSV